MPGLCLLKASKWPSWWQRHAQPSNCFQKHYVLDVFNQAGHEEEKWRADHWSCRQAGAAGVWEVDVHLLQQRRVWNKTASVWICVCKNVIIQAESLLLSFYFIRKSWILLQSLKGFLGCRCQVDGDALQQPKVNMWGHICLNLVCQLQVLTSEFLYLQWDLEVRVTYDTSHRCFVSSQWSSCRS